MNKIFKIIWSKPSYSYKRVFFLILLKVHMYRFLFHVLCWLLFHIPAREILGIFNDE